MTSIRDIILKDVDIKTLELKVKGSILEGIKPLWLVLFMKVQGVLSALNDALDSLKTVDKDKLCPPMSNILEVFRLCDLDEIKVVIIGQDPYHDGSAHGLAFSCLTKVPPSLRNIYLCLKESKLITDIPTTGNLTNWTKQGIFLLNKSLTTIRGKANAHDKIWNIFISKIIEIINIVTPIWLLLGKPAQSIKSKMKGTILEYGHPSPLNRTSNFNKCPHFQAITDKYPSIKWNP